MSEPITNVEAAVAALGALPVPQGPERQPDPIAEGRRLDLLALMDERAASKVSPILAAVLDEADRLRSQVATLLAERHTTNEALDDAVQALRERDGHIAEQKAELLTLHTLRGDVALLVERERGHGEECVDIADVVDALGLSDDESGGAR